MPRAAKEAEKVGSRRKDGSEEKGIYVRQTRRDDGTLR